MVVQRYRVVLEGRRLAPSTINQHLSAIPALGDESAESGLLDQPSAAAICRVKGVPVRGVRVGNWLTRDQAEKLLSSPLTRSGCWIGTSAQNIDKWHIRNVEDGVLGSDGGPK